MKYLPGLLLICVATATVHGSDPSELAEYVGQDVRKMSDEEKQTFLSLFRAVGNDDTLLDEKDWHFVPQQMYRFSEPDFRFFVEIAPGFDRPGFCGLRIHTFDETWRLLRTEPFSTGYRQEITDVFQARPEMLDRQTLVVKTVSAGPWETTREGKRIGTPLFRGKHQLQYYAVVDDKLMLVRREDETGKLVLNRYANWTVPEIGMHYPQGDTAALISILREGSDTKRLALLAWIAGDHLPSGRKRVRGVSQEPIESSRRHESLLKESGFLPAIRDLCRSDNRWVKDYAVSIANGRSLP